eukprot:2700667-Pleurochrysis_carterae.AAC.5
MAASENDTISRLSGERGSSDRKTITTQNNIQTAYKSNYNQLLCKRRMDAYRRSAAPIGLLCKWSEHGESPNG